MFTLGHRTAAQTNTHPPSQNRRTEQLKKTNVGNDVGENESEKNVHARVGTPPIMIQNLDMHPRGQESLETQ